MRLLRELRAHPLLILTAVLCLALGLGASIALFSVFDAVLLRGLPFAQSEELMVLYQTKPGEERELSVSPANYAAWKARTRAFSSLGVAAMTEHALTGDAGPEPVVGAQVSADWLATLGVQPVAGRGFSAEEDAAGSPVRVAMVSHGLWQRRFGGDPGLLGRGLDLGGEAYTVVGVLPPRFRYPENAELWTPLGIEPDDATVRASMFLRVVGRLAESTSLDVAQREMAALAETLAADLDTQAGYGIGMTPIRDHLNGELPPKLRALAGAVALLLLITCANVACLLLARAVSRTQETAVRLALGAGKGHLLRLFLGESLSLALLGALGGAALAALALPPLVALSPLGALPPFLSDVSLDARALAFALGLGLTTGLLCGLAPLLQALRTDLDPLIREGARSLSPRSGRRALSALVVGEVALAVVLLAGSGLLLRSFSNLTAVDLGIEDPARLLMVELNLDAELYPEGHQRAAFVARLLEAVRAQPGVVEAGSTSSVPLGLRSYISSFSVEGRPPLEERPIISHRVVSHGYLETLGLEVEAGRGLESLDIEGNQRVVVISREMARLHWPDEDPIDQRVKRKAYDSPYPWLTIAGIVSDLRDYGPKEQVRPVWYMPLAQNADDGTTPAVNLLVRTDGDPLRWIAPVRQAVWRVDATQPIQSILPFEDRLAEVLREDRFQLSLLGLFAAFGLLLAAVGLYGMISYSVRRMRRDLGIRLALGSGTGGILRQVLARALGLTAAGILLGVGLAVLGTRLLASSLHGVGATDPLTLLTAALLFLLVALLASLLPAWRASQVDPARTLRPEG